MTRMMGVGLTCCFSSYGLTSEDATGDRNCSHVHEVHEIGEAPEVAVLGPGYSGCRLLISFYLCVTTALLSSPIAGKLW